MMTFVEHTVFVLPSSGQRRYAGSGAEDEIHARAHLALCLEQQSLFSKAGDEFARAAAACGDNEAAGGAPGGSTTSRCLFSLRAARRGRAVEHAVVFPRAPRGRVLEHAVEILATIFGVNPVLLEQCCRNSVAKIRGRPGRAVVLAQAARRRRGANSSPRARSSVTVERATTPRRPRPRPPRSTAPAPRGTRRARISPRLFRGEHACSTPHHEGMFKNNAPNATTTARSRAQARSRPATRRRRWRPRARRPRV